MSPLLLQVGISPLYVSQAEGDTPSVAQGAWGRVLLLAGMWRVAGNKRSSAMLPFLCSQDLKFNSISKEINFKVPFYPV